MWGFALLLNFNSSKQKLSDLFQGGIQSHMSAVSADYGSADAYSVQSNDMGEFSLLPLQKVIYSGNIANQEVLIADCSKYGRILVIDGELQSAEIDETLYHEMLVQPAMLVHPNPRRVLLVGGADGACLRELFNNKTVEMVSVVDCSPQLIEISVRHLDSWHRGFFTDPRVTVVSTPVPEFLQSSNNKYDVIVFDPKDLNLEQSPKNRYSKEFFESCKNRLAPGGIFAVQAMQLSTDCLKHALIKRTLSSMFSEVHSYHSVIPSFLSDWTFILASEWFSPKKLTEKAVNDTAANRLRSGSLNHIDGEFLLSCFQFPKDVRKRLDKPGPLLDV